MSPSNEALLEAMHGCYTRADLLLLIQRFEFSLKLNRELRAQRDAAWATLAKVGVTIDDHLAESLFAGE